MRSGPAAAAWLEARASFPLDEDGITQCMRAVLMAFDLIPIDGYDSAMHGWRMNGIPSNIANASFRRGTVHYFRGPNGHVGIATGNGTEVRSTGVGTTGMLTTTAADMAARTGDPYLGYATGFSGTPISFTGTAGGRTDQVIDTALLRRQREDTMYIISSAGGTTYNVFTDANGVPRLRVCGANEAALAAAGGMVITGNPATITGMGAEAGWIGGANTPVPLPKVNANVGDVTVTLPKGIAMKTDVDAAAAKIIADVPPAVIVELKKPGN